METAEIKIKTKWKIDSSHSEIGFIVKHAMISKIKGGFREYGATVFTEGKGLMTSDIDFWIDAQSIDSGDASRDLQLKGDKFLDTNNHREISFQGKHFEKTDGELGNYKLYGDLTMKGITKPIKLNVEFVGEMKDRHGNQRIGFYFDGKLSRKNWDLNLNMFIDSRDMFFSDEIGISGKFQLLHDTEELEFKYMERSPQFSGVMSR